MPLFNGTVAPTGFSEQLNMSGLLGRQMLQYNGGYFTYDPRVKDGPEIPPHWRNSKTSLLAGRSPVSHLSGTEGQNHLIYRQDSNSSEDGHCHSSSMRQSPVSQGFTLYTKSPGMSSPPAAAPLAVTKPKTGGGNSSPVSDNSVYLAIPKPVYGHNPCCHDIGCGIGQRYTVEHGAQRTPKSEYEHDWVQSDRYSDRPSPNQRKAQEALLQQRGLQFETSAEQIKRMTVEACSPSRARTLQTLIEQNYNSCTPTRPMFGSVSEQSQNLHTSPRGYPSLYSSHTAYDHMTSEVYQGRSPMSKYGQLTQHPMFYYPQSNVEMENRTRCKDVCGHQTEDVPVVLRHAISKPRDYYTMPHSFHGEIPLHFPSPETLPNNSFMQGLDYPCYAVPRFHLGTSQIRAPLNRQHVPPGLQSNCINVSPSGQHVDATNTSAASLRKNKPNTSLHADNSQASSAFLRLDQGSPPGLVGQPVSASSIKMSRSFNPLTSLHMGQPVIPPAGLNIDRLLDYSSHRAQVECLKQPTHLPVSPVAWLPRPSNHSSDGTNVRTIVYSPAVAGHKHTSPTSSSDSAALKGSGKRSVSRLSPPSKIKVDDSDLWEMDLIKKRQKMEIETVKARNMADSPPMPVIDNVFSLAPYQVCLQAPGVLFPGRGPPRPVQSPDQCEVKPKLRIKEKKPDPDEHHYVVCQVLEDVCPDTSTEKHDEETYEHKNIKVEKVDPQDGVDSVESSAAPTDCSKITIKKETEDTVLSDREPVLDMNCEPEELEIKPSLEEEDETLVESKPAELTAQMNSPSLGDTCTSHEEVDGLQPKPNTPPQTPDTKLDLKNLPPQRLKLSTYNIIVPDLKHPTSVPPPEKPLVQPMPDFMPKLELQVPVRKHFLELHNCLCKLVSESVSASSEQDLKSWLSQLELTEPPSTKVQKVSRLLGIKVRGEWLNEEIEPALRIVLERLREYTVHERCPFPHVMRTRAVFLPMLVVKELLFPTVQGSFIDQVLQEHKVALRPTTLSEEKILIQLHKRACSSRLRRLMSLKHLPDIYADVLNLLYYTCVCKHIGECMFPSMLLG